MVNRVDSNQNVIVLALMRHGAQVEKTTRFGRGFPDLVVGFSGKNFLLEVKTEEGDLNPLQKKWHSKWVQGQVNVVRSEVHALLVIYGYIY